MASVSSDRRRLAAVLRSTGCQGLVLDGRGRAIAAEGGWAASLLATPSTRRLLEQAVGQGAPPPCLALPGAGELSIAPLADDREQLGWLVRAREASFEPSRRTADTDRLTGLATRPAAEEALAGLLDRALGDDQSIAVLYIDLDDLRTINEVWGVHAGDAVLRAIGARLRELAGDLHKVARMNGDEFLFIVTPLRGMGDVVHVANTIAARIEEPVIVEEQVIRCRASIGVAMAPEDGRRVDQLIARAQLALDEAKTDRRRGLQFYLPEMSERRHLERRLAEALKIAIAENQLTLAFQPQLDLHEGRPVAVEALVRWRHAEVGWISPGDFIPVAERNGLILPIGRQVMREACAQAKRWADSRIGPLTMAVNVSPAQFSYPEIVDEVMVVLEETGLDPSLLTIEVTEGLLVRDVEGTGRAIERLKSLGVGIAVDDFGAGHSSLAYLAEFDVDELKMDRCFVPHAENGPQTMLIANAIASLGHSLGLEVVAEGVETAGELDTLDRMGCDRIQGFLYARPMTALDTEAFLLNELTNPKPRRRRRHATATAPWLGSSTRD